uniref:Uncharacterized protein n=1 Tax=Alexandrium catenella TaxID=2925 RepID=A0A7S1M3H6_ALECA
MNKELCKGVLLDTTYQVRHQVLCNFRDLIKSGFQQDPNVPRTVCKYIERVVDMLWQDIEDEIERDIEFALMKQKAGADKEGPTAHWSLSGYLRFRALVLYHYLPNDKSIWGKMKDPIYLMIFLSMLTPVTLFHFVICSALLIMILYPGPPDEFQLLNFIMIFKGLQFFSSGVLKCVKSSMVEYACYSADKEHLLRCVNAWGPPSTTPLDLMLDYMGTVVLTWSAAMMLKRSKRNATKAMRRGSEEPSGDLGGRRAGGRLWSLLRYDLWCFGISVVVLLLLTGFLCESWYPPLLIFDPQFSANIFWCSIFWSLSTFPFLPLNVQWLFVAFSRSVPTGYNHKGACVAFEIAWEGQPSKYSFKGIAKRVKNGVTAAKNIATRKKTQPDKKDQTGYLAINGSVNEPPSGSMVADFVPAPDQVMLVWDRY